MRRAGLVPRSLLFHARSHLAVLLSAAAASAIITGALLVGDSVRGSLRERALERLGEVEWALQSGRFFREGLAEDLAAAGLGGGAEAPPVPMILLRGSAVHAENGRRAARVNVIGADGRFRRVMPEWEIEAPSGRRVLLGPNLAAELGAAPGDDVLISFEKASDIPREHALGRREETLGRLRLETAGVIEAKGAALFDLANEQQAPLNAFVPLELLARSIGQAGRANAILVPRGAGDPRPAVRGAWSLEDIGLRIRRDAERGHLSVESREFLLSPAVADAVLGTAGRLRAPFLEILTYLATTIAAGGKEIPYSTVAALGEWSTDWPDWGPDSKLPLWREPPLPGLELLWSGGDVLLAPWAFERLGAQPGDPVRIDFYAVGPGGELVEKTSRWTLSGAAPADAVTLDPGWTPEYPGISDARTFSDWDPPFPLDHRRIGREDEEYWKEHRTAPKAFVPLPSGQRLWGGRFGELTAIRLRPGEGLTLDETARALETGLRDSPPDRFGLAFRPVRAEALEAARGGTDFGALFLSMSFFIIAAALLLVAMTFRLALERRARELGLLGAVGFAPAGIARLLLAEGAIVAAGGAALGLAGGAGYAAALIAGLRSWWSEAVNAPFLRLHVEAASLALGGGATFVLSAATLFLVARRMARLPPRTLLAGRATGEALAGRGASGRGAIIILAGFLLAGASIFLVLGRLEALPPAAAFFTGGAALLAAGLALLAASFRGGREGAVRGSGPAAIARLGANNLRRAAGRSLLSAGVMASAAFIIITVAASRRDPASERPELRSGNGGFALWGTSALPLFQRLDSPEGRSALALGPRAAELLGAAGTRLFPFRLRPGDETSCLNLYRPREPRLLGAPRAFIERGGFAWARTLASTPEEKDNPWRLLERSFPDGAVPAIGDQNTVQWILHSGLGRDLVIEDEHGREVKLRIVGLLSRSIFQGELVIPEEAFLKHFPVRGGWSTFLIEAEEEAVGPMTEALETDLAEFGFDARTTGEILARYQAVENTYLSTFLVLGGLGLLLGTLGLGAALLRNVAERRGELALLEALGYSRGELGWLILSESAALLLSGVLLGGGAALVAALSSGGAGPDVPWGGIAAILSLVLAAGLGSSALAVFSALRTPVLPALRREG
jgi:putative ABC transport system permease protein